jgi:hypothetical protein
VTAEAAPPTLPLEWSAWPAKEKPLFTLGIVLFLLAIWIAVGYIYREAVWVLLAVILLLGAVAPFFVITRYRLDEEGVSMKRYVTTMKKRWEELRSYYPDKNGVLVSPFAKPSRLENFRGVYLRFGGNREKVLAVLEQNIGQRKKEP